MQWSIESQFSIAHTVCIFLAFPRRLLLKKRRNYDYSNCRNLEDSICQMYISWTVLSIFFIYIYILDSVVVASPSLRYLGSEKRLCYLKICINCFLSGLEIEELKFIGLDTFSWHDHLSVTKLTQKPNRLAFQYVRGRAQHTV